MGARHGKEQCKWNIPRYFYNIAMTKLVQGKVHEVDKCG